MRLNLPYLVSDTDRHGNERIYVRLNGRKVRLRDPIGSTAFVDAYKAALAELGDADAQIARSAGHRACGLPRLAGGLLFRFLRIQGAG